MPSSLLEYITVPSNLSSRPTIEINDHGLGKYSMAVNNYVIRILLRAVHGGVCMGKVLRRRLKVAGCWIQALVQYSTGDQDCILS